MKETQHETNPSHPGAKGSAETTRAATTSSLVPAGFRFSQQNLADFQTCRRRFQLRYLDRLVWPAPFSQADPVLEALMELGQDFHRAIHQKLIGLDPQPLIEENPDRRLRTWWQAFETHVLPRLAGATLWPEIHLSVPLGNRWLVARLDLVAVAADGQVTIYDWKTGVPPPQATLAHHMQTQVYPFMLAEAGNACYDDRSIPPDQIQMVYWYAQAPAAFVRFPYSAAKHEQNRLALQELINAIAALPADGFPKVADFAPCRRCNYRAYCGRDVEPAPVMEWVDEELDFLMEEAAPYELEEDL